MEKKKNGEGREKKKIWRRRICYWQRGRKAEKEKEEDIRRREIFGWRRRRKRREIFGEGKYLFFPEEREKEGSNWRRKIFGPLGEEKLMVTPTNQPTTQPGEYRAICLFES